MGVFNRNNAYMDEYSYYVSKKKKSHALKSEKKEDEEIGKQNTDSDEYSGVSDLCLSLLQNIDANTQPIFASDVIKPISPYTKYPIVNQKTSKLKLGIDEMVFDVIDNLSPFTPYQKTPKTPANQFKLWPSSNLLTESTTSPAVDSMLT